MGLIFYSTLIALLLAAPDSRAAEPNDPTSGPDWCKLYLERIQTPEAASFIIAEHIVRSLHGKEISIDQDSVQVQFENKGEYTPEADLSSERLGSTTISFTVDSVPVYLELVAWRPEEGSQRRYIVSVRTNRSAPELLEKVAVLMSVSLDFHVFPLKWVELQVALPPNFPDLDRLREVFDRFGFEEFEWSNADGSVEEVLFAYPKEDDPGDDDSVEESSPQRGGSLEPSGVR